MGNGREVEIEGSPTRYALLAFGNGLAATGAAGVMLGRLPMAQSVIPGWVALLAFAAFGIFALTALAETLYCIRQSDQSGTPRRLVSQ